METNNLFQNNYNPTQPGSFMGWNPQNNNSNFTPYYGGGFVNRSQAQTGQSIPVRVVFSPEQIAPQEIPTNGTPALFPLSDGSCIIARSLLPSGLFDERIYALVPKNQSGDTQNQPSEFDQVMARLGRIEENLGNILNDLYGSKSEPTPKKEGE